MGGKEDEKHRYYQQTVLSNESLESIWNSSEQELHFSSCLQIMDARYCDETMKLRNLRYE